MILLRQKLYAKAVLTPEQRERLKKLDQDTESVKKESRELWKRIENTANKEKKHLEDLQNRGANLDAAHERLKRIKKVNTKKALKKAAPWVGAAAALGTGAVVGINAYNKNKKNKK